MNGGDAHHGGAGRERREVMSAANRRCDGREMSRVKQAFQSLTFRLGLGVKDFTWSNGIKQRWKMNLISSRAVE